MKRILIMGLPGTGKTTFAEELQKKLRKRGHTVAWFNADDVRAIHNDWDFSSEGRIKQAERMKKLSESMMTDFVICDFVAPTKEIRDIFSADYTVWMDTEEKSQYEDTNAIFEPPQAGEWDYIVKVKDAINTVPFFIDVLLRSSEPS